MDIYNYIEDQNATDDLVKDGKASSGAPFDKNEWMKKKQEEREQVYRLLSDATEEVANYSGKLITYLELQSRMDRYSVSNALLLFAQKPNASQLKTYDGWKEAGTRVRPGEKGIFLLEPGDEYTKANGSKATSFNPKRVFDISQTFAKTSPPAKRQEIPAALKAIIMTASVPIKVAEGITPRETLAFYDKDKRIIQVQKGIKDEETMLYVLARELSLAHLALRVKAYKRTIYLPSADMAAYMLCHRHGAEARMYPTSDFAVTFSKMEPEEVRNYLTAARSACLDLCDRMDKLMEQPAKTKIDREPQR